MSASQRVATNASWDGQEDDGVLRTAFSDGDKHDQLPHPNLYVNGLPASHLDPESVKRLFQAYGDVESVRVVRYERARSMRAFAFVRMNDTAAAAAALGLNGTLLQGATLFVTLAEADASERPPKRGQEPTPCHTVYIKNVPAAYGPQEMAQLFAPYGPAAHVRLLQDSASCSGITRTAAALVQLASVEQAAAAIAALHDQQLPDLPTPLVARFADPARTRQLRQPNSSSSGGGSSCTGAAAAAAPASLSSGGSDPSCSSLVGPGRVRRNSGTSSTHATIGGNSRNGLLARGSCSSMEGSLTAAAGGAATPPPHPASVAAGRRGVGMDVHLQVPGAGRGFRSLDLPQRQHRGTDGRAQMQGAYRGSKSLDLHPQQQHRGTPGPGPDGHWSSSGQGPQACYTPSGTRRRPAHSLCHPAGSPREGRWLGHTQRRGRSPRHQQHHHHHHQQQQWQDGELQQQWQDGELQQQGQWEGAPHWAAEQQGMWQECQDHMWSGGRQQRWDKEPAWQDGVWEQQGTAAKGAEAPATSAAAAACGSTAHPRGSSAAAASTGSGGHCVASPGATPGAAAGQRQEAPPTPLPLTQYLMPGALPPGSLPLLAPPMHYWVPVAAPYPPASAALAGPMPMGGTWHAAPQAHASPPYDSRHRPGGTAAAAAGRGGARKQPMPRPRQISQQPYPQQQPAAGQGPRQACAPQPPPVVKGSPGSTSTSTRSTRGTPSPGEGGNQSAAGATGDVEPLMGQLAVAVTPARDTMTEPAPGLPRPPSAAAAAAAGQPGSSRVPEEPGADRSLSDVEEQEEEEAQARGAAGTTIEVHNLPEYATSLLLYQTFGPVGAILTAHVKTNLFGTCTGTGYVTFRCPRDAEAAVAHCQQLARPAARSLHVVRLSATPPDLKGPSQA